MATYTTNYNLEKPEASDPFGDFRQSYNDNMDIIDANLGGGGGGGGHTIVDENGSDMPAESKLQFTGNVTVSDDNVNGATVVDVLGGGGGANYGFAIDENNKLFEGSITNFNQSLSYTATEDCIAMCHFYGGGYTWQMLMLNGIGVREFGSNWDKPCDYAVPIRKGDVVGARYTGDNLSCYFYLVVYGIKQGTNGIFAPVIYSDNERKIGVWRDNKPLYQKTFVFVPTALSTVIDISSLQIDKLVERKGTFTRNAGSQIQQKAVDYRTEAPSSNNYGIQCEIRDTNLQVSINGYTYSEITEFRITLYYTKTTDVAGSGNWNTDGVPTVHYSTSEQVIGTWIDGKPLYERVLELTQDTNLTADTWVKTEFNQTTMKALIKAVAVIGSSGAVIEALSGGFIDGKIALNSARNVGLNVADSARLIVQYTKTTD